MPKKRLSIRIDENLWREIDRSRNENKTEFVEEQLEKAFFGDTKRKKRKNNLL